MYHKKIYITRFGTFSLPGFLRCLTWQLNKESTLNLRFLKLTFMAMFLPVISLPAANMCKVDWLTLWRTMGDGVLFAKPYDVMFSRGYETTISGTWSFTKDGHTVSGTSQCGSTTAITGGSSDWHNGLVEIDTATNANNKHCWCRMSTPVTGSSWVFSNSYASSAVCARYCPGDCALCVRRGTDSSCVRSALLAS